MRLDENAASFRFLARANNMSEWMWKNYFECIAAVCVINGLVAPLIPILYYWLMDRKSNVSDYFLVIPYV